MSECVVRMEVPSNCWVCPFGSDRFIWDENNGRPHYVMVRFCSRHSGEEFHVLEADTIDRPWFCDSFICQLPEVHGRLVDADALADDVRSLWDYKTVDGITATTVLNQTLTDIRNCPTIVPGRKERNMSDLIDREAVREFIKSYRNSTDVAFHMEDHLDEIPAASPWRRVEEPPKENGRYFVSWEGAVTTDEYKNGVWLYASMFNLRVTHWMPLPEPPKEDA